VPLTTVQAGMLDTTAQYYSFKNRLINGGMVISQRVGTTSTTVSAVSVYGLDRWRVNSSQASKISFQQQAIASPQSCGNNRYTMNITSLAATTVGASDYYGVNQFIEGFNMQDLGWGTSAAQTVTLSFWIYATVAGTYSGAIRTGDNSNYSYPFTYTINSANTWEFKTVTIPGPTAGTWGTGTSVGLDVWFSVGTGSTFKGTAGSWSANNYVAATGEIALVNTNAAAWYITGVQLEKGSTATSFDYRPYGTELALCQRYLPAYIYSSASGTEPVAWVRGGSTASIASTSIYFTVPSRVPPTGVTVSGSYAVSGLSFSTISFSYASITVGGLSLSGGSGMTVNNLYELQCSTSGSRILFTGCEL
jgi:hypothetical protein